MMWYGKHENSQDSAWNESQFSKIFLWNEKVIRVAFGLIFDTVWDFKGVVDANYYKFVLKTILCFFLQPTYGSSKHC